MHVSVINHPLRDITFGYEKDTHTPYESELLQRYVTLHDEHHQLKTELQQTRSRYENHLSKIKRERSGMENHAMQLRDARNNLDGILTRGMGNLEEITILIQQYDHLKATIIRHHEKLQPMYAEALLLHEWWEDFDEREMKLRNRMGEFGKFSGELYHHYEKYGLDLCSFDKDYQEFLELNIPFKKESDEVIAFAASVVREYNDLLAFTRSLYAQLEEMEEKIPRQFDLDSAQYFIGNLDQQKN